MLLMCVFAALLLADEPPQPAPPMPDAVLERQNLLQLLTIRRVYVDRLTGGETAAQMRDMIMSSLHSAGLFVITESPERADAILRGSAEDLVFTENYSSNEGVNIRGSVGSGSSRSSRGYASAGIGENASSNVSQRRHEAMAAVRRIN